jgi:hypothetical protein
VLTGASAGGGEEAGGVAGVCCASAGLAIRATTETT